MNKEIPNENTHASNTLQITDERYNEVANYIKSLGIVIEETDNVLSSYVFFDGGRFVIRINKNFKIATLLEHELLHIIREDIFVKNKVLKLWNIATDIVVNEICHLAEDPFVKEHWFRRGLFVPTADILPENLDWQDGAETIYRWLLQNANSLPHYLIEPKCYNQITQTGETEKCLEEIKKKITQDITTDNSAIPVYLKEKIISDLKSRAEQMYSKTFVSKQDDFKTFVINIEPKENAIVKDLQRIVSSFEDVSGTNYDWYRSFHREGRSPELPREIEIPSISILFVVDISGSMDEYINDIASAVKYCQMNFKVDKLFFSDSVKYLTGDDTRFLGSGGGTNYSAVLNYLSKNQITYDIIVIISDYIYSTNDANKIREIEKYAKHTLYYNEKLQKITQL